MPATKKKSTKSTTKKKVVAKKESPAKKSTKKTSSSKGYKMQVGTDVQPRLVPHVVPHAGRIPSSVKNLPDHLQPLKVSTGRLFLVEDEQLSQVDSLIEMQIDSYKWFLTEGVKELLSEITPITDFSGKKMELKILGHSFDPPKYDPETCRRRNLSYEAIMKGNVQLINKETGEIKEQTCSLVLFL